MSNSLCQFKQPCPADFALQLADSTVFTCQQVVRIVPQKRLVCRGVWQGKIVYAKLFLGTNATKYAARDAAGLALLVAAKINTPPLLYQGEAADKTAPENKTHVLLFVAIEPADTAEAVWPTLNQNARFSLAKKLVAEVAKHHNAGLLQTDLYLKNFLVADDTIYTLDGDGIRYFAKLSLAKAIPNFITLLSKFDVLELKVWSKDLVQAYFKYRGWQLEEYNFKDSDLEEIVEIANLHRLKAASNYADKKVFRQCTDVNIDATGLEHSSASLGGLFYAASSHANLMLPKNASALDALMQPQNLLKNGNTCTVALTEIDGKKIVIKRYNIKSFWHGVSRAFRQTRAAVSWANAHRLNILGIATAQPVALIESRMFGFLRGKAYFLAEFIDAPNVDEYFAKTQNKTERAEAVKNVVTLFYRLYLLQISHGDMKATNIKMQGTQPVLIDLDSMRQHKTYFTSSVAHLKDLNRFMQNWQNDIALYNAFVKTFKVVYPDISILIKAGIATNKELIK
jgi:tRNA A-37 threonylcarbamoyl transferase component Bud32